MKEAPAGANDNLPLGAYVVSQAEARIEIVILIVQRGARPGLELPADATVDREPLRGAPLVLDVKAIVGVIESPRSEERRVGKECRL